MKTKLLISLLGFITLTSAMAADIVVKSPDGNVELSVLFRDKVNFSVKLNGVYQVQASPISLVLENATLGINPVLVSSKTETVNEELKPLYGTRDKINNNYTLLTVNLKDNSIIKFRVYNDAVAYRWVTTIKGKIKVINEELKVKLPHSVHGFIPENQSYETIYTLRDASEQDKSRDYFLPLVIDGVNQAKLAFTEADLFDYPSLMLRKSNDVQNHLDANFQKYPTRLVPGGYNNYNMIPAETGQYIAITEGTREFPWRVIVLSTSDATLADNDIVYKLASPQAFADASWVKPGKVVWDWWADYVIEGASFRSGINTPTYMNHIDHAAKFGIEYIIVDWQWTDRDDLTVLNPEVDMPAIVNYGKQKGVGVIAWMPSYTLIRQLDVALDMVARWGVAGIKVDFFDRDDQLAIQMYETIAKAAAARKLIVDFHGCTKPTGLQRTYPNIINYEAVLGNEVNKWAASITPEHTAILPFTRFLAGPADFTPGGMRNANRHEFSSKNTLPMVQSTRCHEMAYYVLYYEPLKMFCDATTTYLKELDCFQFLTGIPTVWNETRVIAALAGDYLVVARRSGKTWYIAGITDYSQRSLSLDLSFLGKVAVNAELFTDNENTPHFAVAYSKSALKIDPAKPFDVNMASGGGFIMKVTE